MSDDNEDAVYRSLDMDALLFAQPLNVVPST